MNNWKTTILGALAILISVATVAQKLLSGEPISLDDLTGLGAGGALVWAKDR